MLNLFFMLGLPEIFSGPRLHSTLHAMAQQQSTFFVLFPPPSSLHIQKLLFLFSDLFFSKKRIVVEFFLLPKMSFPFPRLRPTRLSVHLKLLFVFPLWTVFLQDFHPSPSPSFSFFDIHLLSSPRNPFYSPFFLFFIQRWEWRKTENSIFSFIFYIKKMFGGGLGGWREGEGFFSLCAIHSMKNKRENSVNRENQGFLFCCCWAELSALSKVLGPESSTAPTMNDIREEKIKRSGNEGNIKKLKIVLSAIFFYFLHFFNWIFFPAPFSTSSSPDFFFLIFTHLRFSNSQIFFFSNDWTVSGIGGGFLLIASRRWMRNSTIFPSNSNSIVSVNQRMLEQEEEIHFIKTVEIWMSSSDGGEVRKKKYFDFARI